MHMYISVIHTFSLSKIHNVFVNMSYNLIQNLYKKNNNFVTHAILFCRVFFFFFYSLQFYKYFTTITYNKQCVFTIPSKF